MDGSGFTFRIETLLINLVIDFLIMSGIKITKKDLIWSYFYQFFNVGAGLITIPVTLHKLSTDEIALNYLMLAVSSLIGLLDFGFAAQFARNVTYVFSGAQKLQKEGIAKSNSDINYNLVSQMIGVAKMVYGIMAIIALILMLTAGTFYIYRVTDGFSTVENTFLLWVLFSISVYFGVYYNYFGSLLNGRGYIKEAKIAMIVQRIGYIIFVYAFLLAGWGLLGYILAGLISPFIGRFLSLHYFYDKELKEKLIGNKASWEEKVSLFKIIWHNSKKIGLVVVSSYAINRFGLFLAGLFLTSMEVASYGLLLQFGGLISGVGRTYNYTNQPKFAALRIEGNSNRLIQLMAESMNIMYLIMIGGFLCMIFVGPPLLTLIGSNAILPSSFIMAIYGVVILLETNTSAFASFIVTANKVPFVASSLLTGLAISVGSYFSLRFTHLGMLGLILVQGFFSSVYSNWKWPYVVFREFNINLWTFLKLGGRPIICRLEDYVRISKKFISI